MIVSVKQIHKNSILSVGDVYIMEAKKLDNKNSVLFIFPDDEFLMQDIWEEINESDSNIWEIDEEDYTESNIYKLNGDVIKVYKYMGEDDEFDWGQYLLKIDCLSKEDFYLKNYSTDLTKFYKLIYNCFVFNEMAMNIRNDENTKLFLYSNDNSIIQKPYIEKQNGEFTLDGVLDMKSFVEFVEPKYGKVCADFFLEGMLRLKPWYEKTSALIKNYFIWVHWFELSDIADSYFENDLVKKDQFKLDIVLLWLKRMKLIN